MKISSGSKAIDHLLEGGFEDDVVTTLYGPSGSGKTNICLFAAINLAKKGKKIIYIDSEGGFSIERVKQICPEYDQFLGNFIIFQPSSFDEQRKIINKLVNTVKRDVGLIVVDTIGMLYRLELNNKEGNSNINVELRRQVAFLNSLAIKNKIPILIANQVYSSFDTRDKIQLVGGDILKYGSKCLIELQTTPIRKRKAILKKHRSIAEDKEVYFEIRDRELAQVFQRSFRLF